MNNWKEISFPSQKRDWKKFKSNNKSIALNALFAENDKEEIKQAHIFTVKFSNLNFNCENKILLMINDVNKWHFLAVKKLSYSEELHRTIMVINIIVLTVLIHLEQEINSIRTKNVV